MGRNVEIEAGSIQLTTDASAAVGDLIAAASDGVGYPVRALGIVQGPATQSFAESGCVLTGGRHVFAYKNSSSYPAFRIMDAGFTQVVPETVVEAAACSGNTPQVIPLADGGFCLFWLDNLGYPKFATFTLAGAATVVVTQIEAASWSNLHSPRSHCQLTGGNLVFTGVDGTTQPRIAIYNLAGAQVLAPAVVHAETVTAATYSGPQCVAMPDGNVALGWYNSTTFLRGKIYGPTGTVVQVTTTIFTSACDHRFSMAPHSTDSVAYAFLQSTTPVLASARSWSSAGTLGTVQTFSCSTANTCDLVKLSAGRVMFGAVRSATAYRFKIVSGTTFGTQSKSVVSVNVFSKVLLDTAQNWQGGEMRMIPHPGGGALIIAYGYSNFGLSENPYAYYISIAHINDAGELVSDPLTVQLLTSSLPFFNSGLSIHASKHLLVIPLSNISPSALVVPIAPIVGCMTAANTVKQSGVYTVTGGNLPAGTSLKSLPQLIDHPIKAAFQTATKVVLGG